MQKNNGLGAILKSQIEQSGRISFAEYMAQALYHPELGYYTRPVVKIGREGDYYTSSTVHSVFGACLAKQFTEMWEVLGSPKTFVIVEYGAGNGLLAKDILDYAQNSLKEFYKNIQYYIVEISPFHRDLQRNNLLQHQAVRWIADVNDIECALIGCILTNEFLDALPVHRVTMTGRELKEIYVTSDGESLHETHGNVSTEDITWYFEELSVKMSEQQEIEVNLAALGWLKKVADRLQQGFVLTIDYGYELSELAMPQRHQGTLLCYYHHQVINDPYINIGEQDITSHVNFTALEHFGSFYGLYNEGLTTQMKFLVGLGVMNFLNSPDLTAVDRQKMLLAVKRLIMPQGMGESFRVLIQSKGLDSSFQLSGLKSF